MKFDLIMQQGNSESYWMVAETKKEARLLSDFMKKFHSMFHGERARFAKKGMNIGLEGTTGAIAGKTNGSAALDRLMIHFNNPWP